MAATIASTMVLSRLDYSNSLLFGCSVSNIAKLQRIQNTADRIVLNTQQLCPSQQLLHHLHWLPAYFRIKYKTATLTYKVVTLNQPLYMYLTHLLQVAVCSLLILWVAVSGLRINICS